MRIATDYNDYVRPPVLPDIVTMNHAHATHYTDHPDPAIKYVLRGWGRARSGRRARHHSTRDVRVRNVPTNIRDWGGGTERHGNSIFIFEIANLCIAPSRPSASHADAAAARRDRPLDVVLVPVDGNYHARPRRHDRGADRAQGAADDPDALFQPYTLNRFLGAGAEKWPVEIGEDPPHRHLEGDAAGKSPKVLVLPGH